MIHVAKGLTMLEVTATIMGKTETIHPTLIWDTDGATLVDTGYPGQLPLIRAEMMKAEVPFEQLNNIIISHQDIDHIGSLPMILNELPGSVKVLANEIEKPYIEGEKRLLKITPEAIAQAMEALPEGVTDEWRNAFKHRLENPPKGKVHETIVDCEELSHVGGIVVIDTPGHTPGHISLYHKPSKTLIAADAMIVVDGELWGPVQQHCVNYDLAQKSLKKLTKYDIEMVICYHGGLYKGNTNKRIAELVK
jgi:glyoxylase-like metal-dependent hydrolase (beta-lactamase superfamily II)